VLETLPLGHVPEFTVYAGFTHTLCRRKPQKITKRDSGNVVKNEPHYGPSALIIASPEAA
jgi:hypothetical protein